MKLLKIVSLSIFVFIVSTIFSSCSSTKVSNNQNINTQIPQKLEEKVPFEIGDIHFQKWAAGVQNGGSGIHMYIQVLTNRSKVVFDSVYFREMKAKMKIGKMGYFASFNTITKKKQDIIMSNDSNAEYGNTIPSISKFPFDLKDDECVISYIEDEITKYYKVENLVEKQAQYYPSSTLKE